MKKVMVYNDYGGYFPKEQDVIGTIRQTFSSKALRNGWKIIEYEDKELRNERQKQGKLDGF